MRGTRWAGLALVVAVGAVSVFPAAAGAIPAFARRYNATCALCHSAPPKLNAFGQRFAANGFQMQRGAVSGDTVGAGDPLLQLATSLPLAIRVDAFGQVETKARTGIPSVDLLTPYVIKLLSGGQVARNISYYMYFLLTERGEVGGLEDAFLQFTDALVPKLDVIVGQFQASDPIFKQELRLSFEEYQAYRTRVGNSGADLTYERGLMATFAPWSGGDVTAELLNGKGLNAANEFRHFSTEGAKHVMGRFSQDLGPLRLGVFGYYGADRADGQHNRIVMVGPDATMALPIPGGAELNLQYFHRNDENPFFTAAGPVVNTNAGFAELIWTPVGPGSRLYVTGLANWIDSDHEAISLRLGEQTDEVPFLKRYRSLALNTSYLLRRNVRLSGEAGWNMDTKRARGTLGVVAAF